MIINDGGGGGTRPSLPRPATSTTTAKPATTTSSSGSTSGGSAGARHVDHFQPPRSPAPAPTSSGPPAGIPSDAWSHLPPSVQQQIQTHPTTTTAPATPAPAVQLNTPPTQAQMIGHPPPDLKLPMGEWHSMTPEERVALWTPPKNPDLPTLPPYNQQQAHPPPGSDLSPLEWRDMTPEERSKEWNGVPHLEVPTLPPAAAQQAGAPPNSHLNIHEWQEMTPQERTTTWNNYVANNTQYVANPQLRDYLAKHPELTSVQDLINAAAHSKDYQGTIAEAGLDPGTITKFRTANLSDLAVIRSTPQGTLPRDIAQANVYHLVEFNTKPYGTPYNTSFPGTAAFSDNCGPASLAMALRISGKMPAGLNAEQQIDYARYLITGATNGTVQTQPGTEIKIDDHDLQTLGFGAIANAKNRTQLPMSNATGWAALDNSLANGNPVVAAGYITKDWKAQFPDRGTYGSVGGSSVGHFVAVVGKTPDGKYLVSDPMWTGGAVTMTREQLQKFFTNGSPLITTVGQ